MILCLFWTNKMSEKIGTAETQLNGQLHLHLNYCHNCYLLAVNCYYMSAQAIVFHVSLKNKNEPIFGFFQRNATFRWKSFIL